MVKIVKEMGIAIRSAFYAMVLDTSEETVHRIQVDQG